MKKICAIVVLLTAFFVLPMKAETVKVLSINNSLIDYNDQNLMFNSIAATMGKDATWTKHTNLGKTLAYHFNEDRLVPNAKETVAGTAWTHIILQEQSTLPRTNFSQFRSNVETWVNYIRENCPNPDVVIILPINWPFSNDANYQEDKNTLVANYRSVANEFGLTLCPVAIAYGNYQLDHPAMTAAVLYTDDRHPTHAATYLACCMEYGVIFGENPSTITWKPSILTETDAATMRTYAQEAYEWIERTERIIEVTPAISITGEKAHVETFDTIGGEDVTEEQIAASLDGKRSFDRTTKLPVGWRVASMGAVRSSCTFVTASETTMYIGGQSLPSNARNGTWNFGMTGSTDRAIGGITSSISGGARSIDVLAHLHNDSGEDFLSLNLSYDIEKYRNGANEAGFVIQLCTSPDGESWGNAGADFRTIFTKDANTDGAAEVPILSQKVSGSLNCSFPKDGDFYLAWIISPASGDDCAKSMAFGLDNVSITPAKSAGIERTSGLNSRKKMLRDGQLLIINGKEMFNVLGTRVR